MQDISGKFSGAVLVLYDLTDRHRAEEQRAMAQCLQGVLEMAVAAAHEFSQPLQSLFMDIGFLRERADGFDEEVREALESMQVSLDHLSTIISKVKNVTEYKTCDYSRNVRMVDLDWTGRRASAGSWDVEKEIPQYHGHELSGLIAGGVLLDL